MNDYSFLNDAKKVYIAGPISSHGNMEKNVIKMGSVLCEMENYCMENDLNVIFYCPSNLDEEYLNDLDDIVRISFTNLINSDTIYFLDNWHLSDDPKKPSGASIEHNLALYLNKNVFYEKDKYGRCFGTEQACLKNNNSALESLSNLLDYVNFDTCVFCPDDEVEGYKNIFTKNCESNAEPKPCLTCWRKFCMHAKGELCV